MQQVWVAVIFPLSELVGDAVPCAVGGGQVTPELLLWGGRCVKYILDPGLEQTSAAFHIPVLPHTHWQCVPGLQQHTTL